MTINEFMVYCASKKGATESFPFDEKTLVYKVMNKVFALTDVLALHFSANLKCNPEKALELRANFKAIVPGYHMNKKHWNTVALESDASDSLIYELIDDSYNLVVESLSKADKAALALLE